MAQSQKQNLGTTDQQLQLRHLNHAGVRYLAFGDFALGSLDTHTTINAVQLWIDPTKDNINRVNQAFQGMYGPDTDRQLDPDLASNPAVSLAFNSTAGNRLTKTGMETERGLRLYTGISGFEPTPTAFESAWQRREKGVFSRLKVGGERANTATYNQLSLPDLRQNIAHIAHPRQAAMLDVVDRYAHTNKISLNPAPDQPPIRRGQKLPMRDLNELRSKLDIEAVLEHYGYRLNENKGKPTDYWRSYRKGGSGDSAHIQVCAVAENGYKHFIDANGSFKPGTVLDFIRQKENEDRMGKQTFQKVDALLGDEAFMARCAQIPPMESLPAGMRITDPRLRERSLREEYQLHNLTDTRFLATRHISPQTLDDAPFQGRIMGSVFSGVSKDGNAFSYTNTAFPMYVPTGEIGSIDMRNGNPATGQSFKSFPRGERGDALWHSNRAYTTTQAMTGERFTGADQPGQRVTVPVGTTGTVYRNPIKPTELLFDYADDRQEANRQILSVHPAVARASLGERSPDRILISESPVDSLSLHQLRPPEPGEHRLYVATSGTPSSRQLDHIQKIITHNPASQVIIAQDGDNAGIRFAMNYLALSHPTADASQTIQPHIAYRHPNNESEKPIQQTTRLIQIGDTVSLPQGSRGYFETSEQGKDTFVAAKPGGGVLRIGLSEEFKRNYFMEAPVGSNVLSLTMTSPVKAGKTPDGKIITGQQANEQFAAALTEKLNLFTKRTPFNNDGADTEKQVRISQQHSSTDKKTGLTHTKTVIEFPNENSLLVRALNGVRDEIQLRQKQPIFQVVRPTQAQGDLSDVLAQRRGRALGPKESTNISLTPYGALPLKNLTKKISETETRQQGNQQPDVVRTDKGQQPTPAPSQKKESQVDTRLPARIRVKH